MTVRPILVYGDPRLESTNRPVELFDEGLCALVDDLFETGWNTPGLGLAAPQIGINLRLATIDLSVGKDPDVRIILANPTIVHQQGKTSLEEGCLSFPGLFTTLDRPSALTRNPAGAPPAGNETAALPAPGGKDAQARRLVSDCLTNSEFGVRNSECHPSRRMLDAGYSTLDSYTLPLAYRSHR